MCRYIFSFFLFLGPLFTGLAAYSQTSYWPTGVRLGMDIANPLYYGFYQKTGGQYELNTSIDFDKLMLEGDFGWGNIRWNGHDAVTATHSTYTSKGKYFRIGANYNIIQDTPNKNVAFLGIRYARSFFQDHLISKVSYNSNGPIKWDLPVDKQQHAVKVRWYEAVAGVKVKIWKFLYVGGTLRYKFLMHIEGADAYTPYDILGWGLHEEDAFGFNYYLSVRIPLRGAY